MLKNIFKKNHTPNLSFPEEYERVPQDELALICMLGEEYTGHRFSNGNTVALVTYSLQPDDPLSFSSQELIDALHEQLEENSGIIEVREGTTSFGRHYIYYILKEKDSENDIPQGVCYSFQMSLKDQGGFITINGMFLEDGVTGMRDSAVFGMFRGDNPGDFSEIMNLWTEDLYDASYQKGFLMNRSEHRSFDAMFPEHPLSQARKVVDFIIEHN